MKWMPIRIYLVKYNILLKMNVLIFVDCKIIDFMLLYEAAWKEAEHYEFW